MNISFQLTTAQIKNRTKTVTRRLQWNNLKPGQLLQGCVKCLGLRKGEKIQKIAVIRVLSVRREPLHRMTSEPDYGKEECVKEGFPEMTPEKFVEMFCQHMDCTPGRIVNRIEFEYVD